MKTVILTALFLWSSVNLMAFPVGKVIREAVEAAAKISGRTLSPVEKKAAEKALSKAVFRYGDDALRITKAGGLETLKRGLRYGDDFWHVARHADPVAIRSLALHTKELLPYAKRIGPEFLKIEAKAPGVAVKVARLFGDNGVKALAKAPADDISRLVGLAKKSDSPATRNTLERCYSSVPNKEKFLRHLDWKKIAAAGLSTAAIISAYKVSNGAEEGLKTLAQKNPEIFASALSEGIAPFKWLVFVMIALALWPLFRLLWKWSKISFSRKKQEKPQVSPPSEPQNNTAS